MLYLFVQCIVSGLLGVGVDVLRAVDMEESNMDIGIKSAIKVTDSSFSFRINP